MGFFKKPWVLILSIVLGILIVYVVYFSFLYAGLNGLNDKEPLVGVRAGTFGDSFGVLNALFSGMAFSGVLITIFLQRQDLVSNQNDMSRQREESQFYNILKLQQDVVGSFDLVKKYGHERQTIAVGRDCFREWYKTFSSRYENLYFEGDEIAKLSNAYESLWDFERGDLGLYFRSLYSVFRFVSDSKYADKVILSSIVRSLLSDYELALLFYSSLGVRGKGFQKYINEFALFDNLDVSLLIDQDHVAFFDEDAFGSNKYALECRKVATTP